MGLRKHDELVGVGGLLGARGTLLSEEPGAGLAAGGIVAVAPMVDQAQGVGTVRCAGGVLPPMLGPQRPVERGGAARRLAGASPQDEVVRDPDRRGYPVDHVLAVALAEFIQALHDAVVRRREDLVPDERFERLTELAGPFVDVTCRRRSGAMGEHFECGPAILFALRQSSQRCRKPAFGGVGAEDGFGVGVLPVVDGLCQQSPTQPAPGAIRGGSDLVGTDVAGRRGGR